jgi:hypothetical protein
MQLFLDGGADVVTEYPFTMAFSEKIRTALNRFVVHKRSHPELDRELQEQVDRALRFFAGEGNLKWVSLLMWAGGAPRALAGGDAREGVRDKSHRTASQRNSLDLRHTRRLTVRD